VRKNLFTTIFCFSVVLSMSQNRDLLWSWTYDFDAVNENSIVVISQDSLWQIGRPQKINIDSAYSDTLCLITDSVNVYPANDSSSIIFGFSYSYTGYNDEMYITYKQKFDTDTISDFGKFEFSTSLSGPWIDFTIPHQNLNYYIAYDTVNSFHPSGMSSGWIDFDVSIAMINAYNYYGQLFTDSCFFRFTFVSDSIDNNKEGWAIDDIQIIVHYYPMSVNELADELEVVCYPNPFDDYLILYHNEPIEEISLFNLLGERIPFLKQSSYKEIKLITGIVPAGMYWLKIKTNNQWVIKKVIR